MKRIIWRLAVGRPGETSAILTEKAPAHNQPSETRGTRRPSAWRRLGMFITVSMAAAVGTLVLAAPAEAVPSNCSVGLDGPRGSFAICNSGTGAFQSWTQCRRGIWPHSWYMAYGPWKPPGVERSVSACSWGDTRYSYGYNLS